MSVAADERRDLLKMTRMPKTDRELWKTVRYLWGIEIPNVQVCDNHVSPFSVFADAYFARYPVIVVKASRGLAGKTYLMATLTNTETALQGATVTLLGGSLEQATLAHSYSASLWDFRGAPKWLLKSDPTKRAMDLRNGAWVRVLAASTKSARGPHPNKLRLDEVDEMDRFVFTSSLGQPMGSETVPSQTLISSTHHYPRGTFTHVLEDLAPEKGWPIREWCYRESRAAIGGWLSDAEIESTKARIPDAMWDVEYELQEPSIEGRAIDGDAVERAFDKTLGEYEGDVGERIIVEKYHAQATYATGTDWAKENDFTVITTFRTDVRPWRCVAFERTHREPWPVMVKKLNDRLDEYPPERNVKTRRLSAAHDATGLGDVIDDYIDIEIDGSRIEDVKLVGETRRGIFTDYIAAIEDDAIRYPFIRWAFDEHRYVVVNDLYGSGHPPDSIVSGGLGWYVRSTQPVSIAGPAGTRTPSKWRDR